MVWWEAEGGGVSVGERIEDALRREVREETGIEIKVVKFLHFEESFFYFDPSSSAWHGLLFFFLCRPLTQNLLTDDSSENDEEHNPHWVDLSGLAEEDFQVSAGKVLQLVREEIQAQ